MSQKILKCGYFFQLKSHVVILNIIDNVYLLFCGKVTAPS